MREGLGEEAGDRDNAAKYEKRGHNSLFVVVKDQLQRMYYRMYHGGKLVSLL
jgi:hypothetical protein